MNNSFDWMANEGIDEENYPVSPVQEQEELDHAFQVEFEAPLIVCIDDWGFCSLCESSEYIAHEHMVPNPDGSAAAAADRF